MFMRRKNMTNMLARYARLNEFPDYFEDPLTSLFTETDDIASYFEGQKYNTKKRDFM